MHTLTAVDQMHHPSMCVCLLLDILAAADQILSHPFYLRDYLPVCLQDESQASTLFPWDSRSPLSVAAAILYAGMCIKAQVGRME